MTALISKYLALTLQPNIKTIKFPKYGIEILFPKIYAKIILQKNFCGH